MNKYVMAVGAFLVYGAMQFVCGMVIGVVLDMLGENLACASPWILALILLTSGMLTAVVVWRPMRMIRMPAACSAAEWTPVRVATGLLAGLLGVVALNIMGELSNLPDNMIETLQRLAMSPLGALTVGIVGPVCEELVFREGIQGHLHRNGAHPAVAIGVASLLFGVLHFNPLQTFFAALMGVILGVLYYRTGSMLLCAVLHVVNNSLAVVQMLVLGSEAEDFSLCDTFGGLAAGVAVMVVCAVGCVALLVRFWKMTERG